MIKYGSETTEKTYVNFKVVKSITYVTERTAVKNDEEVLREFLKFQKRNGIAFTIVRKSNIITYIDADYELINDKE